MSNTSGGQAQQAEVAAGYSGPIIPLRSLVEPFLALASVYATVPAAFVMPIEDIFALQYLGKVLEVEPKTYSRPARLVRVVSGAHLVALLASLPQVREQLAVLVQAQLDVETQTEAYGTELRRYQAALQEMQAARQVLQARLIEAARPFELNQFAAVEQLALDVPQLPNRQPSTAAGSPARAHAPAIRSATDAASLRSKRPSDADWSLDSYETEWNREHIVLRRAGPQQWEVISGATGYVESNEDNTLSARGDSPNQAWRNFLRIRGRQPSVSTPRQFQAGEVERRARGE